MNLKASLLFASRIFFPRTDRSSIARKSLTGAILCIGISIVPLVMVLTVSNGMIKGITRRMISLSSSHIEAACYGMKYEKLLDACVRVREVPGVRYVYHMLQGEGLISFGKKRTGGLIRAIEPSVFSELDSYAELFYAESGSIENFIASSGGRTAMIGKGIADKLGIRTGDRIRLLTMTGAADSVANSDGKKSGKTVIPKMAVFEVCAVISCGYQELDSMWVFIPLESGADFLSKAVPLSSVMIETWDPFDAGLVAIQNRVKKVTGKNFLVRRWDEINRSQYENFSSTKMLLVFIMLLIVLVAAVNISSALIMLVMERRREIVILKSLGAGKNGIAFSFLVTGFMCGLSGVLIGLPAGLFLSVNVNGIIKIIEKLLNYSGEFLFFLLKGDITSFTEIHIFASEYYLQEIPVEIAFWDLFLIVFSTLLLSVAVSIFPAVKAGRDRPLETLRNTR